MSRLENFIKENRKEFDEFEAPANLWEGIERQLNTKPGKKAYTRLSLISIAATIVIVLTAAIIFLVPSKKEEVDIAGINPDFARQQVHYISLIENKRSQLKQIKKSEPALYLEFSTDINEVEKNYQQLKKELPTSPNQEETLKAMLINLRVQMEVLNQQLNIIEQLNHPKKQSNEKQDI